MWRGRGREAGDFSEGPAIAADGVDAEFAHIGVRRDLDGVDILRAEQLGEREQVWRLGHGRLWTNSQIAWPPKRGQPWVLSS